MTLLRNRVIGGDILGSEALLFIRIPQKVSTEEQEGISNAADCMRGMRVSSSLKPIGLSRQCSACQVCIRLYIMYLHENHAVFKWDI